MPKADGGPVQAALAAIAERTEAGKGAITPPLLAVPFAMTFAPTVPASSCRLVSACLHGKHSCLSVVRVRVRVWVRVHSSLASSQPGCLRC